MVLDDFKIIVIVLSCVHFFLDIDVHGTFSPIFIYGAWIVLVALCLQFLHNFLSKRKKVLPLDISKEHISNAIKLRAMMLQRCTNGVRIVPVGQ